MSKMGASLLYLKKSFKTLPFTLSQWVEACRFFPLQFFPTQKSLYSNHEFEGHNKIGSRKVGFMVFAVCIFPASKSIYTTNQSHMF